MNRIEVDPSPHWIAFTDGRRSAYVTDHFSNGVTLIDLTDDSVEATIPVGEGPHSLELSPRSTYDGPTEALDRSMW